MSGSLSTVIYITKIDNIISNYSLSFRAQAVKKDVSLSGMYWVIADLGE